MDARRKLLHVITRLDLGGAQQNTLFSVANHDRERYEAGLLAGAGGELDAEAERLTDADVHLVDWLRYPISPLRDLVAVFKLKRLLQDRSIDLIHTHSSKAGVIGRLAARLAGVPVVVHTVHGWSFNDTQSGPVRRFYIALERWLARFTDVLVTVAAADRDKGLEHSIGIASRYRVIHSGIDIQSYRRPASARWLTRKELGFEPDAVVVGTVACLKYQKAPLDFIAAAKLAIAGDPRLRFFIAGDGPLRPEVERAITAAGLEGKVRLLGWRQDIPELLAAMDLFVLTSLFEGLPRAVLQAMAAGVPVIATAVNGTPEVVIDGDTGRLIDPGQPDQAAARILELATDPVQALNLALNATKKLGGAFEIRTMVRDLDDLYGELLEKGDRSI
ncbi:MAG: glycosyltransferase family 4 protein [Acidobacteria bacterium]|uniref:Glycosyltransferase family 4 protein n=1 Tax=Candidatus Polarisedimenticola svalbardensis TaxID=2886004 RepID=A0A8J6Y067_9BACT|nr:glycosyltransferase family 4 protein [Candidatus Polarisedimenticola svalbardensis]